MDESTDLFLLGSATVPSSAWAPCRQVRYASMNTTTNIMTSLAVTSHIVRDTVEMILSENSRTSSALTDIYYINDSFKTLCIFYVSAGHIFQSTQYNETSAQKVPLLRDESVTCGF